MKRLAMFLSLILILAGCSSEENKGSTKEPSNDKADYTSDTLKEQEEKEQAERFKTVSSEEAIELIKAGKVKVIDVRNAESYAEAHIGNSENIPYKELETNENLLDQNGSYLIVCKVGKTSEMASNLLADRGFKNIYNLSKGMDGWTGQVVK